MNSATLETESTQPCAAPARAARPRTQRDGLRGPVRDDRRGNRKSTRDDGRGRATVSRDDVVHAEADEAAGSRVVVDALYAAHGPALLAYVTKLLCDHHLAEDVVQETMLRAWRNAALLIPERGSVPGWLMRVAHNIAVDKIRARRARPAEVEETATVPRPLDDHAASVVDSVWLDRMLARLSPAHQVVLREVYFADRTAAQAAEVLGLPVGTVKSRVHHALRRLRLHLEEEPAGPVFS